MIIYNLQTQANRISVAFQESLKTIPTNTDGSGEAFFVSPVDILLLRDLTPADEAYVQRIRKMSPYAVNVRAIREDGHNKMIMSAPADKDGKVLMRLSDLAHVTSTVEIEYPRLSFNRKMASVEVEHPNDGPRFS